MIQREVEVKIEELRRVQNELEVRMSAKLAMIAHRRKLLDELERRQLTSRSARAIRIDCALDQGWMGF